MNCMMPMKTDIAKSQVNVTFREKNEEMTRKMVTPREGKMMAMTMYIIAMGFSFLPYSLIWMICSRVIWSSTFTREMVTSLPVFSELSICQRMRTTLGEGLIMMASLSAS